MTLHPTRDATERVAELLRLSGTAKGIQPPTTLYNEGWMLRLLLDWFSKKEDIEHPLAFLPGSKWYSEALLTSQFLPRKRGDALGESWTHADGVVGDFTIRNGRGDVQLEPNPRQFLVIEAKMFSPLSGGTKRAPMFDQAARNVACMAELVFRAQCAPASLERLGFVVLAPIQQINAGVFADLCDKESIARKVSDRVFAYDSEKDIWHASAFVPLLERIQVTLLPWENAVQFVTDHDQEAGNSLRYFYDACLGFNGPRTTQRHQTERVG